MEFHRLHALVHDRVSSAVRGMDWEYVGLYVRRRCLLHSILPCYRSDRQSSRKYLWNTGQSSSLGIIHALRNALWESAICCLDSRNLLSKRYSRGRDGFKNYRYVICKWSLWRSPKYPHSPPKANPTKISSLSLQVLNLFLALLLSNFGSSSLSAPSADQETNKIAEAFNRISRFKKWVKSSIMNGLKKLKNKITNQISVQPSGKERRVGSVYVLFTLE